MNRRRALLDSGDKILYIYKPGFTSWQNVESVILGMSAMTTTFNSSNVVVKASNGKEQTITITVRKNANNNGWM